MTTRYVRSTFGKILVPVVYGCDCPGALAAALQIAGDLPVTLVGFVSVDPEDTLSAGAVPARALRRTLHHLASEYPVRILEKIHVSFSPWQELIEVFTRLDADLLVLDWPGHLESFGINAHLISHVPGDVALVAGTLPQKVKRTAVALRGGPSAELALRIGLAISRQEESVLASLHLPPSSLHQGSDAPYRGLENVLDNLPEVHQLNYITSDPETAILQAARDHELLIMGAPRNLQGSSAPFGQIASRIINETDTALIIVRTYRQLTEDIAGEIAGHTAISVLVDKWFAENTFHSDEFSALDDLVRLKQQQGLTLSLALPALNEEETVGKVISIIKSALMDSHPLLDEIVLIDSNSTDRTREIAADLDIPVYIHQEILPEYGSRHGKGEALWKSLFVTRGDILIWIDTDIHNIHPGFVYGLIGPMLLRPEVNYVKGFYRRPLRVDEKMQAGGGGRVTELTARPLLNLFFPELSGVIQPLSGEYAGRRRALERLPFFSGYGVETGLLIEMFEKFGLETLAQVDLKERIHRNQELTSLGKMSFAVIQAVISKLESRYNRSILDDVNKTMKLIRYETGRFYLEVNEIIELERPPMLDLPEYRQRFGISVAENLV